MEKESSISDESILTTPLTFIKTEINPSRLIEPITTEFTEIRSGTNFFLVFPLLTDQIKSFEMNLSKLIQAKTNDVNKNKILSFIKENKFNKHIYLLVSKSLDCCINEFFFKDSWINLQSVNNGTTGFHIFITLVLVYTDCFKTKNSNLISEYDSNILLWTMLFHDICKYIKINKNLQEDFSGRLNFADSTHPFKSAAYSLLLFYNNNYFNIDKQDKSKLGDLIRETYSLIINSVEEKYSDPYNTYYIHSFKNIDSIMDNLTKLRQGNNDWIVDIIFLILTHQSLDNNPFRLNVPSFNKKQIQKFYNKRLLELSLIVYVNDSLSYSMFEVNEYIERINEVHIELRKLFK